MNIKDKIRKCRFCDYEWLSKVDDPVSCPRCKKRFDYPNNNEVNDG